MSDLINRQDAIKAIEDLPNCYNGFSDTYDKACIIGTLEEVPSAQQWIPCEERLPEIGEQCLLTVHYVELGGIECNRVIIGVYSDNYKNHILAWMPLPKAYEGEEE